ncbi:hypothetical protein PanWU01x14_213450 [Parasponia andersonii]|uniref:Uncharacterized protein n=1 Tax=Parasponia andersonii TaxID=3476 RepID=A0A2P5BSN3_PARAD|nr:hypothetical protein PanWU01x14_213450 [Parasponia andersonii]
MEKNIYASGKEHMDLCLISKILGNQSENFDGLGSMEDRQSILVRDRGLSRTNFNLGQAEKDWGGGSYELQPGSLLDTEL